MIEKLLHYAWKHRLFYNVCLHTTNGKKLEIVDVGLYNTNDGPDFFNAKIKVDNTEWVGNVEIHDKASQWKKHGHNTDEHYNNVVLHVCQEIDDEAITQNGRRVLQFKMQVLPEITERYSELLSTLCYPPCYRLIPNINSSVSRMWLETLQIERLEQKTNNILKRLEQTKGSWEDVFFITLARNFGFGVNGDAFEEWASTLSLQSIAHHRDNLFQLEAFFLGHAGLLNEVKENANNNYLMRLKSEYTYLITKFKLPPAKYIKWNILRLRPSNFPHIRLVQLALLYHLRAINFAEVLEISTSEQLKERFIVPLQGYWLTHYLFGEASKPNEKKLSEGSIRLIIINTIAPMLFSYGKYRDNERYCERALEWLEQLKPENNNVVRMWKECGLKAKNAADTQALMQLKTCYCDHKECLRCRFGFYYLKGFSDKK